MKPWTRVLARGALVAGLATGCASHPPGSHPPATPLTNRTEARSAPSATLPSQRGGWTGLEPFATRAAAPRNTSGLTTSWMLASHTWGEQDERSGFPLAERLSSSDWLRISQGWTVGKKLAFDYRGRAYVGGVAHQIVRAGSQEILESLLDEETIQRALPLTKEARIVGRDQATIQMELVQGTSLTNARYTVGITRASHDALRFSLIDDEQNDVRDLLGYVTATPYSKTHALVTVALGVDLGSKIKRALFQKHVQEAAVSMPAHMRRYLESRAHAN